MRLGSLEVLPVLDGAADIPAEIVLSKVPHPEFLTPEGLLTSQFGGYLIRTAERLLLVDTGIGPGLGGALLDSLAGYGVQPADVTDVLLTHLHADHIGWVAREGNAVFPNATYRCHEADWQHFVEGGSDEYMRAELGVPLAAERLSPLASRFELFDRDGALAPGVFVRHAPGHTPGSTVVVLSGEDERALLMGDVLHCPVELTSDDWEMLADVDGALARRTREGFARELEGSPVAVGAAHFPGLRFGRLLSGRAWAWAD